MKNRVFFIGKFATINLKAKDFSFGFGRFSVKRTSVFSRKRRFRLSKTQVTRAENGSALSKSNESAFPKIMFSNTDMR